MEKAAARTVTPNQRTADRLSDIAWFLKGRRAGLSEGHGSDEFDYLHIDALRQAICLYREAVEAPDPDDIPF